MLWAVIFAFIGGILSFIFIYGFLVPDKVAIKHLTCLAQRKNLVKVSLPLGIVGLFIGITLIIVSIIPLIYPLLKELVLPEWLLVILAVSGIFIIASVAVLIIERINGKKVKNRSKK